MKRQYPRSVCFIRLSRTDFQEVGSVEREDQRNPWTDGMVQEELNHGQGFHFGARTSVAGPLAAYILCRLFAQELHIHRLCTRSVLRRQGYGRALLKHTLAAGRSNGACVAFLEVGASNIAAVTLYKRFGFAVDAERKKYYADGNDALLMSRPL